MKEGTNMFLRQLTLENQNDFLKICIYAVHADGIISEQEKKLLSGYCDEMGLPFELEKPNESIEKILDRVNVNASNNEKRIILLETIGLLYSDKKYVLKEQQFVRLLSKACKLDTATVQIAEQAVEKLMESYRVLNEFIA